MKDFNGFLKMFRLSVSVKYTAALESKSCGRAAALVFHALRCFYTEGSKKWIDDGKKQ